MEGNNYMISEFIIEENEDEFIIGYGLLTLDKSTFKGKYKKVNNNNYEDENYIVSAYVKNTSSEVMRDLSFDFKLYNKDGVVLGVAYSYIQSIDPDETWKLKAVWYGEDSEEIADFKLLRVSTPDLSYSKKQKKSFLKWL